MFVSSTTGEVLQEDKIDLIKKVPKQLPEGVSEEQVKAQAESASGAVYALIIVQLLAQLLMKGKMDALWSLYFAL